MKKHQFQEFPLRSFMCGIAMSGFLFLGACSDDSANNNLSLDMDIPESMTGARALTRSVAGKSQAAAVGAKQNSGEPCFFNGNEDEDPFENGYDMTKFMVSTVATWICVADTVIDISDFVPHDGLIRETENDKQAANYDPEEPTHYSVTNDSEIKTTVRAYYGYDRATPPTAQDEPQFFVSWVDDNNGNIEGRLIIDALAIENPGRDPEDPSAMRMDFDQSVNHKTAQMFLRFDAGNEWAEGFRIDLSQDLIANPLEKVYVARGLMDMKRQFIAVPGVTELPVFRLFTVSDQFGEGAAIAEYNEVSIPMVLNAITGNHLGNYIFDKTDKYFFDADQSTVEPWDFIDKTFSSAAYRGGRTTPVADGTLDPFDPSLDIIITELNLEADYFTNSKCENIDDNCTVLLNSIFADGFAGQEPNQGQDPQDWRSDALANPQYLGSVYPDGFTSWDGVFERIF